MFKILGSTALLLGPGLLFSSQNPIHSMKDSLDGDQPITRSLLTHRRTQNKHTQTSMPPVGFEPKISVLEQLKTVHVLDYTVTVIIMFTDIKSQDMRFYHSNYTLPPSMS
jgi:hypothetical protein